MAYIGNPKQRCVSTDHIAVPRGGMFGDIAKWEPVLNRNRLYLAWSLIFHTFLVYSKEKGFPFVCQMHLRHRDGGPIPLDSRVVSTLTWARENFRREDQTLVKQMFEARKRRAQSAEESERMERAERSAADAFDAVSLDLGLRTPKIMVELGKGSKKGK
jgi:hypothetical protein